MATHIYRGTSFDAALDEEFADGRIHGRTVTSFSGFIDPDELDEDWSGSAVSELPWDIEVDTREVPIAGGISNRLGAAESFATGLPVVFHFREGSLGRLTRIQYDYGFFDTAPGAAAWVDGTAEGELRANETLVGLTAQGDLDEHHIRQFGNQVERRVSTYEDEMEHLSIGREHIDISSDVEAVVSYCRRPVARLAEADGYSRLDLRSTPADATVIGDWSDQRAMEEIWTVLRNAAPSGWPVYVVHTNTHLTNRMWRFEEHNVEGAYTADGHTDVSALPGHVLGD